MAGIGLENRGFFQIPQMTLFIGMIGPVPAVLFKYLNTVSKKFISVWSPSDHTEFTDEYRDIMFFLECNNRFKFLFYPLFVPVAAFVVTEFARPFTVDLQERFGQIGFLEAFDSLMTVSVWLVTVNGIDQGAAL